MNLPRLAILALVSTGVVLTGCSNSEPAPVLDHDAVLRLKLSEYRIQPQVIRVQAVSNPMIVQLIATNVGHLTHNVHVESVANDTRGTTTNSVDFGGTATAQPGQTERSGYLYLPPGRYRLTCTISNHDNLGMHGTLIVDPPKATLDG